MKWLDIAVDSSGRAWVFSGDNIGNVNSLRIYDQTGLVMSYPCSFIGYGGYGSFFINDQLYVGFLNGDSIEPNFQNSIVPININGSIATIGLPIPFPYNGYLDMASCNKPINLNLKDNSFENKFLVYPNPVKDILNINSNENIKLIDLYTLEGKLVGTYNNSQKIDISKLQSTIYLLEILTESNIYYKKIIKK